MNAPTPRVIIEATRQFRSWREKDPPNVVFMPPEDYEELNEWCRQMRMLCELEGRPWGDPIECNRLLGMEILTFSGPVKIAYRPDLRTC